MGVPSFLFDLFPHRWADPQFLPDLKIYEGPFLRAVRENPEEPRFLRLLVEARLQLGGKEDLDSARKALARYEKALRQIVREAERAIGEVRKGLAWAELRLRHLESVLRQLRVLDPKKARKI